MDIRPFRFDDEVFARILGRGAEADADAFDAVREMVDRVRREGDAALFALAEEYDGFAVDADSLCVTQEEMIAAEREVDDAFIMAIAAARTNIRRFHEYQRRQGYLHDDGDGVLLSKRVLPVRRAGVYCPGGTAPLFSSMLMNVIPAQVAGVEEIVAVTPPDADGRIDPHLLVTARLLGLETVLRIGGPWSVAALAYGTASVPRVDVVVGPGNQYVTLAKRLVTGVVGIDMAAGPSEVAIICDRDADARYVAADLLSQVEHGSGMEAGVVFTDNELLARRVGEEVDRALDELSRADAARRSLDRYGAIFVVQDLAEAVAAVNRLAPEHLEILTADPEAVLEGVENAGAVFLGPWSPEPVGDYFCGTNHVLPTGGAARYAGSLSVNDFLKDMSVVRYSAARLTRTGRSIAHLAELEGLTAHARSVQVRMDDLARGAGEAPSADEEPPEAS